jgi:flagellar protein FliS
MNPDFSEPDLSKPDFAKSRFSKTDISRPRFSYCETAVQGAGRVRLVILLYEQAIEDLRRALAALSRRDIEARTREIKHALLVLGHLQSSLNKNQGGKVAANLERFYAHVRKALIEAQCRQSASLLEQQIALLMQVREAWRKVERAEEGAEFAQREPHGSSAAGSGAASERSSLSEWNA